MAFDDSVGAAGAVNAVETAALPEDAEVADSPAVAPSVTLILKE
jgi:hypothetical protein